MTDKLVAWLQSTDPRTRVRWAMRVLIASFVAWPASSFTLFRGEPQGVLALSWLALILTCVDIIFTTDVRDTQEDKS